MLKSICLVVVCAAPAMAAAPTAPTYSKDVAPILNARCVACHRSGEIGPMQLTSYQHVRPWAKSIRDAVIERKMPPWHADPTIGEFKNDRRLTDDQVRTITQWVAAGAPEGNLKDMPPAPQFIEGWSMGKPDVEIKIPRPIEVPEIGRASCRERV